MISVIVCTYNRSALLRSALDSLQRMKIPAGLAWELIIVDNNSSDDTQAVVSEYRRTAPFDVRYVFEGIQGHSRARNRGIVESRGGILAFTDDDVTVEPEWLSELWNSYSQPDCLGAGGRIVPVWRFAKPAWLREERRTAIERYGLFRTDLGGVGAKLMGNEDTEFGYRLLRNGEMLIYNPRVIVHHPVERERATQRYFERWYFEYGRALVRQTEIPPAARDRLRWQKASLRSLGASMFRWMLARRSERRLYYRLAVCQAFGQTREAFSRATPEDGAIPRLADSRQSEACADRRMRRRAGE
jgi:glycosyltransferase involved in cell wall biosynthesis